MGERYRMSKIKICGLRRPEDIAYVNECKPDYVGFIIWPKSKRYVTKEQVLELRKKLDPDITAVGVFVNEDVDVVADIVNSGAIDVAQIHGDESNEYLVELKSKIGDHPIVRAVRVASEEDLRGCEEVPADYILFDKFSPQYGGTGHTFDWSLIKDIKKPFFLAGGLNQENILEAIDRLNPYCVDLSSAVEGEDGYKDHDKVVEIVNTVKGKN